MGPPNLAPDEDHENIPLLETHVLAEDVSLPPVLTLRPSQLYELLPVHQQPQAIRLLDLEREDTNIDAPLKGTLRVANLRDCPKFAALSYAWGSWSSPRDIITCNNSRIEITSNCHEALRNLRRLFGPITIWVDSICIHQDDDIEKAAQIPLMEEIYTFAQPTYIWLGAGIARERAMGAIILAARSRVVPAGVPWFRGHNPRTVARDKFDNFKRVMKASWLSICGKNPHWVEMF